eukprot:scaffold148_cov341-Pavlova_lutheri.AAC.3
MLELRQCYKASVEDVGHTVGSWDPRLSTWREGALPSRWVLSRIANALAAPLLSEGGLAHDLFHASSGVLMVRVLCWWSTVDVTSLSKLISVLQSKEGLLCLPLFLSHRLLLAVGNRSKWGGAAVHVLPKVTSDRPLGSPRGGRELAVASSPFLPPSPTFSKERQGRGRVIRSVCPSRTPQYPFQGLVLTRGDPPSIRYPSSQP